MNIRKSTLFFLVFVLAACNSNATSPSGFSVVATTNIVGDVVSQVGGDNIDLTVLLPIDADPHGFQPTPQDLVAVENAQIVFVNGLGLEEFLADMVETVGGEGKIVAISEGIQTIEFSGEHEEGEGEEHEDIGADPHVWMDPNNVVVWADNIAAALSASDPDNANAYTSRALAYQDELVALDNWIEAEIEQIVPEERVLVTDHDALGYFANRYGFELIGTLIPGSSTLSEPSAAELAALEDLVFEFGVPAIFVGTTVNPNLAQRVADDTGVQLVPLYTGSLSDSDGSASTYLEMIRYNVGAIVNALK